VRSKKEPSSGQKTQRTVKQSKRFAILGRTYGLGSHLLSLERNEGIISKGSAFVNPKDNYFVGITDSHDQSADWSRNDKVRNLSVIARAEGPWQSVSSVSAYSCLAAFIFTPGPMVLAATQERIYWPLAAAGLALMMAPMRAV